MRLYWFLPRFHNNLSPLVRALVADGHEVRLDVRRINAVEDHRVARPVIVPPDERSVAGFRRRLRAFGAEGAIIRDPDTPAGRAAALAALAERIPLLLYTQRPVHRQGAWREAILSPGWWPWRVRRVPAFSPVPGDTRRPRPWPWLHYLPFAADPERAAKQDWFRDGRVNVLTVGKFMARKNLLAVVEAFERAADQTPMSLTVIGTHAPKEGDDVLEAFERRVAQSRHRTLIHHHTNLPTNAMATHYLAADLFILASHDEPAAVSPLEAMTHGLPVLCSMGNGTAPYIRDGGRTFDERDPAGLVRALDDVAHDRAWLVNSGTRARAIALETHHPRVIADRLIALLSPTKR